MAKGPNYPKDEIPDLENYFTPYVIKKITDRGFYLAKIWDDFRPNQPTVILPNGDPYFFLPRQRIVKTITIGINRIVDIEFN